MTYGFEKRSWPMASAPEGRKLGADGRQTDESEAQETKTERVAAAIERLAENTAKEARREGQ